MGQGVSIVKVNASIAYRSASHRIVEGERDADLPSWKFFFFFFEAFATNDPRRVSSSFRIKKKKTRKKNILLTFFKNGRVIYAHYLGLEKELNRMLFERRVVARVSFSIDLQSIKKNSKSNFSTLPIKLYDILSIQLNIHTRAASERGHERGCRNFLSLKESAWERERDEGNYLNRYVDSCARTTRLPGCIDDLSSPGANGYGQVFIHQRRDVFRSRGRWRYHAMATARAFL